MIAHGSFTQLTDMHDERLTRLGRIVAAASIVIGLGGTVAVVAIGAPDFLIGDFIAHNAVLAVGFGALAWLALAAQPRNGAVWALLWSGFFGAIYVLSDVSGIILARSSIPDFDLELAQEMSLSELPTGAAIVSAPGTWTWIPAFFLMITAGLLLFPDGVVTGPRWRWLPRLSVVVVTIVTSAQAWVFRPSSTVKTDASFEDYPGAAGATSAIGLYLLLLIATASVASLVVRYRRSSFDVRRQILLIACGGASLTASVAFGVIAEIAFGEVGVAFDFMALVGAGLLVASFAIAILRYRLYDIELVVSKSVTYLGLATVITAIFAVVVAGPVLLLGESDGDSSGGVVLPIVATGLVAVVFEPIRSRMQRWANRLVYGDRSTPHEVLSQLTTQLAGTRHDGADDIARVLAEGTGAERVVVWRQHDDDLVAEGSWPALAPSEPASRLVGDVIDDPSTVVSEVRHGEQLLGVLTVTKPRNDPTTPAERELIADVAAGAGLLLRNIGLNRQLERRADQVRESRLRLIATQDSERRRLERDLHDGAQQQVVALKVKLNIAKTLAEREGADEIARLATRLTDDAQNAIDSLREVAHGIYPPLLEAEGLELALRNIMRRSVQPLDIATSGLTRYPRQIERTVYFCVVEIIEQARTAEARRLDFNISDRNGELAIEVDIDIEPCSVIDLTAVTDRIDAFGGSTSGTDGTRMTTRLPTSVHFPEPA